MSPLTKWTNSNLQRKQKNGLRLRLGELGKAIDKKRKKKKKNGFTIVNANVA